jgi:hypothetical protein
MVFSSNLLSTSCESDDPTRRPRRRSIEVRRIGQSAHLIFVVLTSTADGADTQLGVLAHIARSFSNPDAA